MWNSVLISVEDLKNKINSENLILLDATIDKVNETIQDKKLEIIPNSLFFDIEKKVSDHQSNLPHTLVSESIFNKYIQELGIQKDSIIVIYDRWGIYSSPRAWWTFKTFGFDNVFVLNGGFPAWKNSGLPFEMSYIKPKKTSNLELTFDENWLADKNDVLNKITDESTTIVDARSNARFLGNVAEPRKGLRSGHIPNSCNLFFEDVLNGIYYKEKQELESIFNNIGSKNNDLIFSCGSGITASILALAAYSIDYKNVKVYDGSWSEWGKDESLPIE